MVGNRDQTSERIVAAAFDLIAEEGLTAFGVNGVARRAGADKKLIYRYFDGLDGLYAAMGRALAEEIAAALDRCLSPPPAKYGELVARLVIGLHEHLSTSPRARTGQLLELGAPPEVARKVRETRGHILHDWMQRARGNLLPPDGCDAAALNSVLIAAVEGLAFAPPAGLDEATAMARARSALIRIVSAVYGTDI